MNENVAVLRLPVFRRITRVRAGVGLALLLAVLWLCGPLIIIGSFTHGQWYESHDGMRWPYLLTQFSKAFTSGMIYPRWMPNMLGGYGYPSFVFYQPLFFYIAMGFFALVRNEVTAVAATSLLAVLIGGAGAYKLARHWNGRRFSMLCAAFFMLTPYAAFNLYTRGDLTEHFAMQLCPWSLHFGLRLAAKVRAGRPLIKPIAAFVLSTAIILLAHPFVALFFLPFLGVMLLVEGLHEQPSFEVLWVSAMTLMMVMVVTMPYWFSMIQMKADVTYYGQKVPLEHYHIHLLTWDRINGSQLLSLWGALAAALAFAAGRGNRQMRVAGGFTLLYALMLTEFSRPLWEMGSFVLKYVLYSIRMRGALAITELVCIALAGASLRRLYADKPAAAVLIAGGALAMALTAAFNVGRMGMTVEALIRPMFGESRDFRLPGPHLRAVGYADAARLQAEKTEGLFPRTMRRQGLENRTYNNIPLMQMASWAKDKGNITILPGSTPFVPSAEVHIKEKAAVLINQFYFPGWRVEVNHQALPWNFQPEAGPKEGEPPAPISAGAGANGRVRVWFENPGTYRLRAWYEGPPHWRERNLFMLVAMLLLIAGCYWRHAVADGFMAKKVS